MRATFSFCTALMFALATRSSAEDRIPADVRDHLAKRVEQGYCAGIVVGVVDEKGTSFAAQGSFTQGGTKPVGEDTLFEIGSITKVFTAILLADMADRDLVALDDPVQKCLPASARVPTSGDKSITLRDLATHRSGLPRMPDNFDPKDSENPYADYTAERMLQFLADHELTRDPGAEYEYSNLGAGLLGYALAQRAGKPYEQLVIERISEPLGLKDTRITLDGSQRDRLATGHVDGKPTKNWDLDALAGAGAIRSTPRDMVRFVGANLGLVDSPIAKTLQAAQNDPIDTEMPEIEVALGWHVLLKHGATIIWHNGGTGGYHSFCGFRHDKKLGVVVLTNSAEDVDDIGRHLLEPKYALKDIRTPLLVEGKSLEDFLGYYELAPGVVIHVTRDGDQLFAQLTGQDKFPVFPESSSKFFFKVVDAQLSFVRGTDGKVDHVILHQNGDRKCKKLADYKPPVRAEVPVDSATLAAYTGKYEFVPGVQLDVKVEGGQLKAKLTGQQFHPVFAESPTKFYYKVVEAQLTFNKDESGKVVSVVLHQGGRDQTAKRLP